MFLFLQVLFLSYSFHMSSVEPTDLHLQETLQSLAALLNDLIREAVGEDLSRKWGDVDSGRFSLQHIPEPLEIRVAATDSRRFQLESRDIGLQPMKQYGKQFQELRKDEKAK